MSKNIEREEGRRGKLREFSMNSKCRCILFSQHFYFFLSLPRMINDNIFLRHGKINLLSSIKLMFEEVENQRHEMAFLE